MGKPLGRLGIHAIFMLILYFLFVGANSVRIASILYTPWTQYQQIWARIWLCVDVGFYTLAIMIPGGMSRKNDSFFSSKGLDPLKPELVVYVTAESPKEEMEVAQVGKEDKQIFVDEDHHDHQFTMKEIQLSKDLVCCAHPKQFFTFPHPVNATHTRLHAYCGMALMITHWILCYWLDIPYVIFYLCYGFLARFLCGPKIDPQAWLVIFISNRIKFWDIQFEPGPPKRAAQFFGLCFVSASILFYFNGFHEVAHWILLTLFFLVALQAIYGYCGACLMFYFVALLDWIPKSVMKKAKMVFIIKEEGTTKADTSGSSKDFSRSRSDAKLKDETSQTYE